MDTTGIRATDPVRNISKKLQTRYQGPYPIKEILNKGTYRLQLPETTKMHNAFHTSVLKPYRLTERGKYPERDTQPIHPGPVDPEEPDILAVDKILKHRYFGRTKKLQFRILWEGYPPDEATWEPALTIYEDAPDEYQNYLSTLTVSKRREIIQYITDKTK